MATENQQAIINDVIYVKRTCICIKLKQIQLIAAKNTPSSSDGIGFLLNGKTIFSVVDYYDVLEMAKPGDLVYMDLPYQGVTNVRDNRYFAGVPFDEFAQAIRILNQKGVDYLISYDGACGGKEYGEELPKSLDCEKVMLNAGVSSQALLLGKKSITFEALYVSKELIPIFDMQPQQLSFLETMAWMIDLKNFLIY